MILEVFTIFDAKAGAYNTPFYLPTRGAAIRAFSDTVADSETMFHKHPEDFTLFILGSYDDSSAIFSMLETPHPLGLAQDFKDK